MQNDFTKYFLDDGLYVIEYHVLVMIAFRVITWNESCNWWLKLQSTTAHRWLKKTQENTNILLFIVWKWLNMRKYDVNLLSYKQNITWKMSCILLSNLEGWWVVIGSGSSFFFRLLSWKNCCITSAHSVANTPLLIFIFGWNGWTGAGGISLASETLSPPSGKSLQSNFGHYHKYHHHHCLFLR